jgi:Predicted nucleotide-binding protein containing TIR-like domain
MKPTLFVGSSTEALPVARAVQAELHHDVDVTLWNQDVFKLSSLTVDALIDATAKHDLALFVLAADDLTLLRDELLLETRDNVIFELGMFFTELGRGRCFFLKPGGLRDFRIPTDLLGVTAAEYNGAHPAGLQAGVGPACTAVRTAIDSLKNEFGLSGVWEQCWNVDRGSGREPHPSEAKLLSFGSHVRGTWEALGRSYSLRGQLEHGRILTGTWRDSAGNATYFGSFQLRVSPLNDEMTGCWVGWSRSDMVRSGDWTWKRRKSLR